jgi:plastocyanin
MFAAFLSALPLISVAVAAAVNLTPAVNVARAANERRTYERKVHEVTVGGAPPNQISFVPNTVQASPGDIVRFSFKQKNHTVTRTSFEEVCKPLLDAAGAPIFDSGFQPVPPEQTDNFPVVDFTVLNEEPNWFYCQQTRHCGQGMFGQFPGITC